MGDLLGSPRVAFLFLANFFFPLLITKFRVPGIQMVVSSKKNEKCILSRFGYTRGPWRGTSYAGPTGLGRRVEVRV